MKKLIVLPTILIAIFLNTSAQIPNNGFEIWEDYIDNIDGCTPPYNVYQKPDMWNGSLPKSCQTYSYSLQKNNESYPAGTGQFSLKIQADVLNGVRGIAISNDGSDYMNNWIPKPSFVLNQRPSSLYLYYKYLPSGGDTMFVQVYFYKNGAVIGNSYYGTSETISNWTALQIPLTYNTSDIPDSATILFVTGAYVEHSGSILYVDNLSFTGFITSKKEINQGNIQFNIFHHPSSGIITLNIKNSNADELVLYIYNSIGTLVKKEKLKQNQRQIDISELNTGIYFVEIHSKSLIGKQKLLIRK